MSKVIPMMTTEEANREVEKIIVPEIADGQVRALVSLIYQVTNFENPPQANLAKDIALAAYRQTTDYAEAVERAFANFLRNAQAIPLMDPEQNKADEQLQQTTSSAVH